jgi:hypothetical protein
MAFNKDVTCQNYFNEEKIDTFKNKFRDHRFEAGKSYESISFYHHPNFHPNSTLQQLLSIVPGGGLSESVSPSSNMSIESSSGNSSDDTPSNGSDAGASSYGSSPQVQQHSPLPQLQPYLSQCPPVPHPQILEGWFIREDGYVEHRLSQLVINKAHNLWYENEFVLYGHQFGYWQYFPFSNKARCFQGEYLDDPTFVPSLNFHPSNDVEDDSSSYFT